MLSHAFCCLRESGKAHFGISTGWQPGFHGEKVFPFEGNTETTAEKNRGKNAKIL
jgi:hypothetical protein